MVEAVSAQPSSWNFSVYSSQLPPPVSTSACEGSSSGTAHTWQVGSAKELTDTRNSPKKTSLLEIGIFMPQLPHQLGWSNSELCSLYNFPQFPQRPSDAHWHSWLNHTHTLLYVFTNICTCFSKCNFCLGFLIMGNTCFEHLRKYRKYTVTMFASFYFWYLYVSICTSASHFPALLQAYLHFLNKPLALESLSQALLVGEPMPGRTSQNQWAQSSRSREARVTGQQKGTNTSCCHHTWEGGGGLAPGGGPGSCVLLLHAPGTDVGMRCGFFPYSGGPANFRLQEQTQKPLSTKSSPWHIALLLSEVPQRTGPPRWQSKKTANATWMRLAQHATETTQTFPLAAPPSVETGRAVPQDSWMGSEAQREGHTWGTSTMTFHK